MTIAFTALSGSRFWSRHVLLSGPKLQNKSEEKRMFSQAKQQTSGRFLTANNTIVKCFFKFMPLVSVSFHQSCPKFWWYAFYRQHKAPSSPEQRIFPLISSLQQFDKSFVSRHFCYGVSDVNSFLRQYRLNSPTLLWDYSHIVPLNQIEVTSETWTSIVYNLVVSGAISVIRCPCDWQFSRPAQ